MNPDKAFILAAGLGARMRPLTLERPKPLAEVAGRTLLGRTLDRLTEAGVRETVINTHHLAEMIPVALKERTAPRLHFSHEPELLDTGGGIKNALRYFGDDPFYVLSGDGLWSDGPIPALDRLGSVWDRKTMDVLIMLQPVSTFTLTKGVGDYDLLPGGRAIRSRQQKGAYMFTSMRINHPRIFKSAPEAPFSYLSLLDEAEKAGRLYGIVHDAEWHHLSTVADLEAVNRHFAGSGK